MSAEWKPGDAAVAEWMGADVRGIIDTDGRFYTTDQRVVGISSSGFALSNLRPLVVLDLDLKQVDETGRNEAQLLVSMLRESADNFFTPEAASLARKVADQIAEQIAPPAPPKPPEPTGLGAVVEDASQVEFIHLGSGLWVYGTTDGPSRSFTYDDIDAVTVLSGGVIQ